MLTLYFSIHDAEALSPQFSKLLANSDILLVENGSCDGTEDERVELLDLLSDGKITPEDIQAVSSPLQPFGPFERKLASLVFRSRKRIELERSPLGDSEGAKFLAYFSIAPKATSLEQALQKLKITFNDAAELVRRRDEAFAYQLSELVKRNPNSRILTMMGSGHQRALMKCLRDRDVSFNLTDSTLSWVSPLRSLALEKVENGEALTRLELLRALAEFFPPPQLIRTQEAKLVRWWAEGMNESQLVQYLKGIYSAHGS